MALGFKQYEPPPYPTPDDLLPFLGTGLAAQRRQPGDYGLRPSSRRIPHHGNAEILPTEIKTAVTEI
jgi:hypothetical protein